MCLPPTNPRRRRTMRVRAWDPNGTVGARVRAALTDQSRAFARSVLCRRCVSRVQMSVTKSLIRPNASSTRRCLSDAVGPPALRYCSSPLVIPAVGSFPRAGPSSASPRMWRLPRRVEEAGVVGRVRRRLSASYQFEKRLKNGEAILCKVQVFPLEVERQERTWPEKGKRKVKWFSPDKAAATVDEAVQMTHDAS